MCHGLSSQALLLNLLGPLIVDRRWDLLTQVLQKANIPLQGEVAGAESEVENPKVLGEISGQPTSVDLCLYTTMRERVFVEFKFTEADFSGCSVFRDGDCDGRNPTQDFDLCYLHRNGRRYWPRMGKPRVLGGKPTERLSVSLHELVPGLPAGPVCAGAGWPLLAAV